ncbi:MAG: ABC transporter transmembrane domain-containing protein [Pseudomonadota bacterium]|nr:ABC transporter transmembrane domain-containing protein [Pseudomonadota bacterium]
MHSHNAAMEEGLDREVNKDLTRLTPALKFLRPYVKQVVAASFALVITAGATLSIGQGLRLVIDSGFASGQANVLVESITLFAAFVLVLTIGTFVRFYFVSWVGERVSADIRLAVFRHLIRLHPGFFEVNAPSEIQSRITTDTTLLQTVIGSSVSIALRNVLMFVGGLALLFVTNAKLSLIVVASVPFVVAPVVLFGRRVRRLSRTSQDRLAVVGSFAGESLRHIKIVQSFNHENLDDQAFTERVGQAFTVSLQRIRQRAVLVAIVMLLVFGAVAAMLWVGGQDVLRGDTTAGELAAFIFYAFIVAGSVGAISEVLSDLQRAAGAMERLMELMHSPNEIIDPKAPKSLSSREVTLSVEALSFSYSTRPDVNVLENVSFKAVPGEMIAVVGPSGAGKSTLFDLMQRFYVPSAGSIKLDGIDTAELKLQELRGRMGFVPQDPVMFAGSIRENLLYANAQARPEAIDEALRLAHAIDFVTKLPDQLATVIGEGGVGLSGGERQRLAIARALISNPAVLLLDEATSALDAESEHHIRLSIEGLKGQMTIVVIAHRLSTVRQADRILVLDEGRLLSSGSHEELMASSDLYAKFAKMQFAA